MFNRDATPLKLSGWAAPADAADADSALSLSLMAGSVKLGALRRDRKRADVDEFLDYEGPPSGFAIDDFGLAAFAEITGFTDFAIELRQNNGSSARYALMIGESAEAAAEPLGCRHGIRKSVRLADLWLDSNRKLTLRFEGAEGAARRIDAYQCIPGGEPMLIRLGPERRVGGAISTATFALMNAFFPVLLLFSGEDEALDAIDLLPFPSLLRGGRHAAERLIDGRGGDDVSDTANVSAELLRLLRDRPSKQGHHVSTVEIDSSVTTGIEASVDEDMLAWLGDSLGLHLRFASSGRSGIPKFIAERVAAHSKRAKAGHKLQLPADAIPTIASLVNAYPAHAAGQTVCGSFAVIDWNRHGSIWSVWQPPVADWLDGLQLGEAARFAPMLTLAGAEGEEQPEKPLAPGWPLALVFRQQPTRVMGSMPFETSVDLSLPLLRNGALPTPAPLGAIILFDDRNDSPVPLLESLARQESVGPLHVTLCWPAGRDSSSAADVLQSLFADRHRRLPQPPRSSALEQLIAARKFINTPQLLVLQADTILPDPRTVATLLPMLAPEQVLSVGCLLRSSDDKARAPIGAGYSLSGLDLRGTPALSFEPIDPAVLRQPATYAVVANSMAAMLVKSAVLEALESSGSVPSRRASDELMMGVHAIEEGGINLCTTIVSAYSGKGGMRGGMRSASVPYRLSPKTIAAIAEAATFVQRIR